MIRNEKTLKRMNERMQELVDYFDDFVEYFDHTLIFSGPSLYFHQKCIDIVRTNDLSVIFENKIFFEYLYATLASWGLHRMGETNTKLVDFDKFKESVMSQKEIFLQLRGKRITELNVETSLSNQLQALLENLKIGKGETKLIFNSKAVHHLLPDLMPPIDRQYTLLFFYNSKSPSHIDDCFSEIFPKFVEIAVQKKNSIYNRVGEGFHTSETKVIDNAIVGYVLKKNLKGQKRKKMG